MPSDATCTPHAPPHAEQYYSFDHGLELLISQYPANYLNYSKYCIFALDFGHDSLPNPIRLSDKTRDGRYSVDPFWRGLRSKVKGFVLWCDLRVRVKVLAVVPPTVRIPE